jgi:branched-chain amino acid transport system substrate-binding protein
MKKFFSMLMIAVILCMMLSSCGGKKEEEASTYKIGFIGPLTGATSMYGNAVMNGAQMYFDEVNKNGGINGKQVEFITVDSEGDKAKAKNAYERLVNVDKVCAIVGPVLTGETEVVAQAAAADGIPCITASATGDTLTSYGDSLFRTCFKDSFQGVKLADYFKEVLGFSKVAVLYANNDAYSNGLYEAFRDECSKIGVDIVATESYSTEESDYKAQLTNIVAAQPEALFFPYYYAECYDAATQAKDLGLNVPFLGGDGFSALLSYEGADMSVIEGFVYSDHFSSEAGNAEVNAFAKAYSDKFGYPALGFSFLAYDAAMIVTAAIDECDSDNWDDIRETMKKTDMDCLTGHYVFDSENNPIKQAAMIIIKNGEGVFDRMF